MAEPNQERRFAPRPLSLLPAALVLACLLLAGFAGSASAAGPPYGAPIEQFSATPSTSQAGAHPDLTIKFKLGTRYSTYVPPEESGADGVKNVLLRLPQGFIGNPHVLAECTASQFALDECPPDSQVGIAAPSVTLGGCCTVPLPSPLYNLVPQPGQASLQAFKAYIYAFPIFTVIRGRTESDYGLDAEVKGISGTFQLGEFEEILWGVPASPIHDAQRYKKGGAFGIPGPEISSLPERPYFSNPTTCPGPVSSELVTKAYDGVEHAALGPWPPTTGCDQLNFNPSLAAKPSTEAADSASGLDVALKVPQNESPVTPSDSELKGTTVTMPAGFSINSSAADGKVSCSEEEARIGTPDEAQCPKDSKVGTLAIDSSALPEPIDGGIYLGKPLPGDPYRLIVAADGFGTHVKLAGDVHPDPQTGQLTVTFENLPQSPLTEFDMHFFGSERGLLATPTKCGTYSVRSEFEPWATGLANQESTQFFSIDNGPGGSPCPGATRPFGPSFRAVGAGNGAGAHSPFSIYITRADGDQTLSTIGVKTPPGFTATLKGVPYCADSTIREIEAGGWTGRDEIAAPKCPSASQVGVSWAGAGAGSKPFYAPGHVYLSGPYKGAPLSFTVVTPAVSGPYDLGNVVNRVAINVDPATAQVTATSDPLPQILQGIPLRLRSVLINLDRKDFTLNPTSCKPFQVTGLLGGSEGASAGPQGLFQVANCDGLGFEPKLTTVLKGGTKRTGHPALKATLTQEPTGQSNIARAVVTLPHSEFLDQGHIRTLCTRVQFAAKACPAASVYGRARVVTPILDQPLEGPVYLRSSSHKLPDLVAALKGPASQPIEIELDGRISTFNQGIRTSFELIPDAPVSKFVLEMQGGKKGLLVNSTDICKGKHLVEAKFVGQSGARFKARPALQPSCGGKKKTAQRKAGDR